MSKNGWKWGENTDILIWTKKKIYWKIDKDKLYWTRFIIIFGYKLRKNYNRIYIIKKNISLN